MKKVLLVLFCSFNIYVYSQTKEIGIETIETVAGGGGSWSIGHLIDKSNGDLHVQICYPWISICKLPNILKPLNDDNELNYICLYQYDKKNGQFKMKVNHKFVTEEDKSLLLKDQFSIESYEGSIGYKFPNNYIEFFNFSEGIIPNGNYEIDNNEPGFSTIIFNNVK